jgi:hypothetical protein
LLFVISCFVSFLEHVKENFLYLLYLNNNHEKLVIIYPPFKVAHAYPQYITNFDKKFTSEPCDDHDQFDEHHKAKADTSPPVLGPTPSKSQHRYVPLKLPQVLRDFPPNHYEYLHVFDGEPNVISTEKHIQGFEHFIDLFEIDHDDVCMRALCQSLRGHQRMV